MNKTLSEYMLNWSHDYISHRNRINKMFRKIQLFQCDNQDNIIKLTEFPMVMINYVVFVERDDNHSPIIIETAYLKFNLL